MPEVRTFGHGTERPRAIAVGCGGAGCNTLRAIPPDAGVERLAVNDLPHPSMAGVKRRLLMSKEGLRGIAAMDEQAVKSLATTAEQSVAVELADADFVVPIAGLGGEMGSWGASLVARVAGLKGATTLAVATMPFSAEGMNRRGVAIEARKVLRTHAHGVLGLPNDSLLRVAPHLPILRAFEVMSKLAVQPLQDLLRVLTRTDLPVLKSVLRNAEDWQLGIGEGVGDHPELAATEAAFRSPWITRLARDAREVLVLVGIPVPDERVVKEVLHDVDLRAPLASVTSGIYTDPSMDRMRVTVLVGF